MHRTPHTTEPDVSAYCFAADAVTLAPPAAEATGPRAFSGVAYSGDVILGHPAWPALVLDLDGIRLPPACPTLLQHDRAKRVGVCALSVADGALRAEGRLLRNPEALALAADADDGFPWQMSVHADPASLEEVGPGQTVQVNGRAFSGPLTVFRGVRIRELSFTPTGYDHRTAARVFSTGAGETPALHSEAPDMQTIEALTAQVATLTQEAADAKARAEAVEAHLAQQARSARLAAVNNIFADLGRTVTEADAAIYLALDEAAWAQIRKDLSAARPKAPGYLFEEQATADPDPDPAGAKLAATISRLAAL